jgi:hypothetical protein
MRVIEYKLNVLCKDSAGEWVEVYDCFNSFRAEELMERFENNSSVVRMWITETLI